MKKWTKLVVWQILAIMLTVGVFYGTQAMGASELAAAVVAVVAFAVVAAFAFVAFVAAAVDFVAFVAVAVDFVAFVAVAAFAFVAAAVAAFAFVAFAVAAAVVVVVAFAFAFADELHLKYRWVLVSMLIETGAIIGALMLNSPAGLMTAGAGVALEALLCWLGADAAEKSGPAPKATSATPAESSTAS